MPSIRLTDIIIKPNRQRQKFDPQAMQELKNSIEYDPLRRNAQLQNPPVLRKEPEGWTLVAGERRLKTLEEIFALGGQFMHGGQLYTAEAGMIPFTDIGELSELEAEEAELDENLKRRDLTWQEHAAAVARLHTLRQGQAMEKADKAQATGVPQADCLKIEQHTIADTAEELTGRRDGSYQDTVRKEILVAGHLSNPAIAKAKSADEAFKILKRQEATARHVANAAIVGASFSADKHTLLHTDCLTFMTDPANHGKYDVILTDPPYGMGAQDFGNAGGKMSGIEHHYDDSYEAWVLLMTGLDITQDPPVRKHAGWCILSYHIVKAQAHAYVFCDIDRFHELKEYMQAAGWYVFRTPLINYKTNSGRVPLPNQGPRRQYEILLYAIKGGKPVTHIYPDVISSQSDENMSHGAQKPVAVYENLLQRSVRAGDSVIDTFAGTGPIFPAAHTFKCSATGLEQTAEYYSMAQKRLADVKAGDQPMLFE